MGAAVLNDIRFRCRKSAAGDGSYFTNFISHAGTPMLFFGIFIALTAVVVMLGVQKGIEKSASL